MSVTEFADFCLISFEAQRTYPRSVTGTVKSFQVTFNADTPREPMGFCVVKDLKGYAYAINFAKLAPCRSHVKNCALGFDAPLLLAKNMQYWGNSGGYSIFRPLSLPNALTINVVRDVNLGDTQRVQRLRAKFTTDTFVMVAVIRDGDHASIEDVFQYIGRTKAIGYVDNDP